ncbi:MAG: copper transporter [Actinobacteria bacterium]|nr:copper transporter [Actinomycetota bacterium]
MISFRYHLVTIVAVFLALGLGLLAGTTVLNPRVVTTLENRTESLLRTVGDLRGRVDDLQATVSQLQEAGDILPYLDSGGLVGTRVVIVTHDGVDDTLLAEARRALDTAGADVVAILSATDRIGAPDLATQQSLAGILGFQVSDPPPDLLDRAALLLGERLADGPRAVGQEEPVDVLEELLSAGFLAVPAGSPGISDATVPGIGGRDQVLVVLGGGDGEPAVAPETFLVPLVNELVRRNVAVAAGEGTSTSYPFVETLRTDGAAREGDRMVTVDDLDLNLGGAALVLGLEQLLSTGQGGNYGVKAGATGPIPRI